MSQAHDALMANPAIRVAAERVAATASDLLTQRVAVVERRTPDELEAGPVSAAWLRGAATKLDANAFGRRATEILKGETPEPGEIYVPLPTYHFCIPPNPLPRALRLHAELNLYKLRHCRNIAGLERQLDIYAAPTDTVTGLPQIGSGGQLVLPGLALMRPTPYRYATLIERARQLVQMAAQTEAAMLAAFEKRDAEAYSALKARQDLRVARSQVRLQDLRINEANDGVKLADLQQDRAQIEVDYYQELLNEPISVLEALSLEFMIVSASLSVASSVVDFATGGYGAGVAAIGQAASTTASILATYAGYERRKQEWEFHHTIAQQDVRISAQGVRLAEDRLRIVGQERSIAGLQADNSEAVVDFLSTKFTNLELYDWMGDVLGRVYAYFLQQATAMAQLAASQLAFERQETPPALIQSDYWSVPTDDSGDGKAPDRRGLTGSARLLQDIAQLDQYAFDTNKRRRLLTKTFSFAELAPAEFQRFRETGIMRFDTTLDAFDRSLPGDFLRLIRRVRPTFVGLLPTDGIVATLTSSGTARVVIGGDTYQTMTVRRAPEAMVIPSARDTIAEPDPQPDMLGLFEALPVATRWELRAPKAANLFDYRNLADFRLTIDYSALHSPDYEQAVMQSLRPILLADRAFSFRHQFADQWFDLNNPERTYTPMTVRFTTVAEDFPANVINLKIAQLLLHFARADGKTFEVPVSQLRFTELGGDGPSGGGASSVDGTVSTRAGNAGSWSAMMGKSPVGDWELSLPDTGDVRRRFANQEVTDILFVISYSARTADWPT